MPCCTYAGPSYTLPPPTCGVPDASTPPPKSWMEPGPSITNNLLSQAVDRGPLKPVLRIVMNHGTAGFFAYVLFAINQLRFAAEHNLIPYIDFGPCTVNGRDHYASGGPNQYFDASAGENMWEYYFEPVSDYRPGMPGFEVKTLPSKVLWHLHEQSESSVFAYPYGRYKDQRGASHVDGFYTAMRLRAHDTLMRYVRVKQHILNAVESFWRPIGARGMRAPASSGLPRSSTAASGVARSSRSACAGSTTARAGTTRAST